MMICPLHYIYLIKVWFPVNGPNRISANGGSKPRISRASSWLMGCNLNGVRRRARNILVVSPIRLFIYISHCQHHLSICFIAWQYSWYISLTLRHTHNNEKNERESNIAPNSLTKKFLDRYSNYWLIDDDWLMFCDHFCAHGRLNGPYWLIEVFPAVSLHLFNNLTLYNTILQVTSPSR